MRRKCNNSKRSPGENYFVFFLQKTQLSQSKKPTNTDIRCSENPYKEKAKLYIRALTKDHLTGRSLVTVELPAEVGSFKA